VAQVARGVRVGRVGVATRYGRQRRAQGVGRRRRLCHDVATEELRVSLPPPVPAGVLISFPRPPVERRPSALAASRLAFPSRSVWDFDMRRPWPGAESLH
jgi:hypothetical protein